MGDLDFGNRQKVSDVNPGLLERFAWGTSELVEWNSLDRDPMRKDIMSPFIARDVSVSVQEQSPDRGDVFDESPPADAADQLPLRYEVEFSFNGPLFLAGFFLPVLLFYGVAWVVTAIQRPENPPTDVFITRIAEG